MLQEAIAWIERDYEMMMEQIADERIHAAERYPIPDEKDNPLMTISLIFSAMISEWLP